MCNECSNLKAALKRLLAATEEKEEYLSTEEMNEVAAAREFALSVVGPDH